MPASTAPFCYYYSVGDGTHHSTTVGRFWVPMVGIGCTPPIGASHCARHFDADRFSGTVTNGIIGILSRLIASSLSLEAEIT
jgi:hypothetical protein